MFSGSGFREKSVERIVAASDSFIRRHLAIGLDAVLQAEELPTGIAYLAASLADVNGDALPHGVG